MQDDEEDMQHCTKANNVLPINGDPLTMNLNGLVLTNIQQSPYYQTGLSQMTLHSQLVDEIYYQVKHLEPWERGTRQVRLLAEFACISYSTSFRSSALRACAAVCAASAAVVSYRLRFVYCINCLR